MSLIYKRNDTADFEFTFIDVSTNQPIDVLNPIYTITYFNGNVEVIVVSSTPLIHLNTGFYAARWTIPSNAPINQTYFVHATGEHPISHEIIMLDKTFQVFSESYFSGGLVVKFTKD